MAQQQRAASSRTQHAEGPPSLGLLWPLETGPTAVAACQGAVDTQRASSGSSPPPPPEPAQIVKANVSGRTPHHRSQTRRTCTQCPPEMTVAEEELEGIRQDTKRSDGFLEVATEGLAFHDVLGAARHQHPHHRLMVSATARTRSS